MAHITHYSSFHVFPLSPKYNPNTTSCGSGAKTVLAAEVLPRTSLLTVEKMPPGLESSCAINDAEIPNKATSPQTLNPKP